MKAYVLFTINVYVKYIGFMCWYFVRNNHTKAYTPPGIYSSR